MFLARLLLTLHINTWWLCIILKGHFLFLGGCEDTKDWDDGRGSFAKNCEDQKDNCEFGHPKPGHEGYMGTLRNYPENNCCVCGKFEQGREFSRYSKEMLCLF